MRRNRSGDGFRDGPGGHGEDGQARGGASDDDPRRDRRDEHGEHREVPGRSLARVRYHNEKLECVSWIGTYGDHQN